MRCMAAAEGSHVVLERSLVLEVGAADAEPQLPTVLLVGAPVTAHCECLTAPTARERPHSVLALVMRLQCPKVLERP